MLFRLDNSVLNTSEAALTNYAELGGFHKTAYADL